jgi:hypothetical protein
MPVGAERLCKGGCNIDNIGEGFVDYAAGMVSVGVTYASYTFHDHHFRYANNTRNTAKYLSMNLDTKLRWKEHIKMKRDELNIPGNVLATWTQL